VSVKDKSPGVIQIGEPLRVMGMDIVNSLLITLANCSKTAVWVFGSLLAADLAALCVHIYRSGNADKEEGHVVTDDGPPAAPSVTGDGALVRGIQLAFLLFWLTFVCGALTLLASDPAIALAVTVIMSCGLYCGVTAIRGGRANALGELAEERAAAHGNRQRPPPA
jgi:hypothetical protein